MKAADKGEEGRLTYSSTVMERDHLAGAPGLPGHQSQISLELYFSPCGSGMGAGYLVGITAKFVPILRGCWGVAGVTHPCPGARESTKPLPVLPR